VRTFGENKEVRTLQSLRPIALDHKTAVASDDLCERSASNDVCCTGLTVRERRSIEHPTYLRPVAVHVRDIFVATYFATR
jgi:hypothetical protein